MKLTSTLLENWTSGCSFSLKFHVKTKFLVKELLPNPNVITNSNLSMKLLIKTRIIRERK